MAILDIRGTNGSGKSYIVHRLLRTFAYEDLTEKLSRMVRLAHYIPKISTAVVGSYNLETESGGCDSIPSASLVKERIDRLIATYNPKHVIIEGIMVSRARQHYLDMHDEYMESGFGYKFLFLSTPLRNCIARVMARRVRKGKPPDFNTAHLTHDYHRIMRILEYCRVNNYKHQVLSWKDPMPEVAKCLMSD